MMKHAFLSLLFILLNGCVMPVKDGSGLNDGGSVPPIKSGVLKGKTSKGEPCSLEVISYSEKRYQDIETPRDREYTDLEKTIEVRLDFQHDAAVVFVVKSYFNTMWDAFETNYLTGRHQLEEDRTEFVKLYLNHKNQIVSVDYYKDASHVIMGVSLGDKQMSCGFLE